MSRGDLENVYADIRQRVSEQYHQRYRFARDVILWLIVVLLFVASFGGLGFFVPFTLATLLVTTPYIVIRSVRLYFEERRESAIRGEFERYAALTGKSKRSDAPPERLVTLSEDGELFDLEDADDLRQKRL